MRRTRESEVDRWTAWSMGWNGDCGSTGGGVVIPVGDGR